MKNKLKSLLIGFLSFSCILLLNTPADAGVSATSISIGSSLSRTLDNVYQISPAYYFYIVTYLIFFFLSYTITNGELKAAFGLSLFVSAITLLGRACIKLLFGF
jgi:hypothetical protein